MFSPVLLGLVLALGSSICFAANRAVASKPLVNSGPVVATYISLIVGVIVSGAATILLDQASMLLIADVSTILIFAIVGIFHFGIARNLSFTAIKHIGANESSPIMSTQVLYSILFAILLLGETLTFETALGALVILGGVFILERRTGARKRGGNYKIGFAAAALTGVIYGLTPILIKYGLSIFHFFVAATFIAFVAGLAFYASIISPRRIRSDFRKLPKPALLAFCISGVFAVLAQLFRFGALNYAPVVLVVPLLACHPIFTVLFTRRLAKDFEVFQPRIVLSVVLVVLGTVIVSYSSGVA